MVMPNEQFGNPEMGYAPATQDTGNPGALANASAQIQQAVKILETVLSAVPIGTKQYNSVIESIKRLSSNFPANEGSPGVQDTAIESMLLEQQRMAPMNAIMRAMAAPQPTQPPPIM
jgi:hypothetical protein